MTQHFFASGYTLRYVRWFLVIGTFGTSIITCFHLLNLLSLVPIGYNVWKFLPDLKWWWFFFDQEYPEFMEVIQWSLGNLNSFFHLIHGEGLWMPIRIARKVVRHGFAGGETFYFKFWYKFCFNMVPYTSRSRKWWNMCTVYLAISGRLRSTCHHEQGTWVAAFQTATQNSHVGSHCES